MFYSITPPIIKFNVSFAAGGDRLPAPELKSEAIREPNNAFFEGLSNTPAVKAVCRMLCNIGRERPLPGRNNEEILALFRDRFERSPELIVEAVKTGMRVTAESGELITPTVIATALVLAGEAGHGGLWDILVKGISGLNITKEDTEAWQLHDYLVRRDERAEADTGKSEAQLLYDNRATLAAILYFVGMNVVATQVEI